MSEDYVILLGSNLGKKEEQILEAIEKIEQRAGTVVERSGFRSSSAWGKTDQDDFVNVCLVVKSDMEPLEFLDCMQQIEQEGGRQRSEKWGARTLDIDILYNGDLVMNSERLVVPHPYISEREFTLVLLNEVLPLFVHPVLQKTNQELYKSVLR